MLLTSQHLKVQTINKECQGTSIIRMFTCHKHVGYVMFNPSFTCAMNANDTFLHNYE